jgi:hypothetical protein
MKFSKWYRFDQRQTIENVQYPGIYAIAISASDIAGTQFDYRKEIAYFGMTNSKGGLRARLNQFNKPLRDKLGHGGAERFRYDYQDGNALAKLLYLAVCHFKCDVLSIARKDLETMGDVARAEYLALAEYAERFGRLPKYNDKKNSPKRVRSARSSNGEQKLPTGRPTEQRQYDHNEGKLREIK